MIPIKELLVLDSNNWNCIEKTSILNSFNNIISKKLITNNC